MQEQKQNGHGDPAFSERTLDYGLNPACCGDMDRPDGHARITGPCGDTVDMYLRIREGMIEDVKFTTDGCIFSIAACDAAARLATGLPLQQGLAVEQNAITEHLGGLPDDHVHCALLAAKTLHEAVDNYTASKKPSPVPANPAHRRTKPKNHHAGSSHGRMKGGASI